MSRGCNHTEAFHGNPRIVHKDVDAVGMLLQVVPQLLDALGLANVQARVLDLGQPAEGLERFRLGQLLVLLQLLNRLLAALGRPRSQVDEERALVEC